MYYYKQDNHENTLLLAFNYSWIELYKTYLKTTISKEVSVIEMFPRVKEAQRGSWLILKSISTFLPFTAHLSTSGSRVKLAILIQSITIFIIYWCVHIKVRHWQGRTWHSPLHYIRYRYCQIERFSFSVVLL